MKLATFVTLLLTAVSAVARRSNAKDSFDSFHARTISSLAPIKLDDSSFDDFTALPRNHTSAVLLTALAPQFGCQLCRDFQPEWDLLTSSWSKGDTKGRSRMLFGTLDFLDGRQTFQSLGLQTAPILMLYKPTVGENAKVDGQPLRFDFSMGPQSADSLHNWLSRHLPESAPKPPIRRPVNYVRIVTITTLVTGIITAVTVAYPYLLPILNNRSLWAALSLISVLLFTSGHMFNHIRQAPYVSGDGKGGIAYFASGFQNQFGLESQIVGAMYAILAFATISLALKVPRMTNPKSQQAAVFIWVAVMYGMYSFLLSIFRLKSGGYPFWLPPF